MQTKLINKIANEQKDRAKRITYQSWIKYQTCWASDWIWYPINTKVEFVTNLRDNICTSKGYSSIYYSFRTIDKHLGPLRTFVGP